MKNPDVPMPNTGEEAGLAIDGRPAPYLSGVPPKDFVQRLDRLKKAGGITWDVLARSLGVDKKQVCRWRKGRRTRRPSA